MESSSITRSKVIYDKIRKKVPHSRKVIQEVLDGFAEVIIEELTNKTELVFKNVGVFYTTTLSARIMPPRYNETRRVYNPPTISPRFRFFKSLRAHVNHRDNI